MTNYQLTIKFKGSEDDAVRLLDEINEMKKEFVISELNEMLLGQVEDDNFEHQRNDYKNRINEVKYYINSLKSIASEDGCLSLIRDQDSSYDTYLYSVEINQKRMFNKVKLHIIANGVYAYDTDLPDELFAVLSEKIPNSEFNGELKTIGVQKNSSIKAILKKGELTTIEKLYDSALGEYEKDKTVYNAITQEYEF